MTLTAEQKAKIKESRKAVLDEVKKFREEKIPVITGSSSALYFEDLDEQSRSSIGCTVLFWETKLVSWSKDNKSGAGYLTLCHFSHPILGALSGVGDPEKVTGESVTVKPIKGKDSPKEGRSYVRWELS